MKNIKKVAESPATNAPLTFHQAMQRLEAVVSEMESAELPLEQLLQKYEEGTRLLRFCHEKLNEAQKKIEILRKKTDGSLQPEPFDATSAPKGADEETLL
ncbi:MAG: exodeoxyribonuclease VII small subunit [Verrucomicrobiae bacterium]|nr:exodeoxyribonuclease VII small subunit [Verrucomicrobiae bacterium]